MRKWGFPILSIGATMRSLYSACLVFLKYKIHTKKGLGPEIRPESFCSYPLISLLWNSKDRTGKTQNVYSMSDLRNSVASAVWLIATEDMICSPQPCDITVSTKRHSDPVSVSCLDMLYSHHLPNRLQGSVWLLAVVSVVMVLLNLTLIHCFFILYHL